MHSFFTANLSAWSPLVQLPSVLRYNSSHIFTSFLNVTTSIILLEHFALNECCSPSTLLLTYSHLPLWQHWTYTLDMVDSFLGIFPDKESHLLWDSKPVPFYLSPAIVRSRADRYKIVPNFKKAGTSVVRVYSAVSCKYSISHVIQNNVMQIQTLTSCLYFSKAFILPVYFDIYHENTLSVFIYYQ